MMSTQRIVERHQIEGHDPDGRFFNRTVEVKRVERGYEAALDYEGMPITNGPLPTIRDTIHAVVSTLQQEGFTQLRTRLNFRKTRYLAEKEPWVTHPDLPRRQAGMPLR